MLDFFMWWHRSFAVKNNKIWCKGAFLQLVLSNFQFIRGELISSIG